MKNKNEVERERPKISVQNIKLGSFHSPYILPINDIFRRRILKCVLGTSSGKDILGCSGGTLYGY
jgi:hypothetical protein